MIPRAADAYLFLSLLQARVGTSVVARMADLPPESILQIPPDDLAPRLGLSQKVRLALKELRDGFDAEAVRARLSEGGYRVVTPVDGEYPEGLSEVPDPPPALFVDGGLLGEPAVAIVGSRKASATALDAARALGRALGERGVCVVSGLALGVDAAAHEGALEAGGATFGVLGCGIDGVYPKSNRGLFGRVREAGGLVSEYGPGEPPLRWRFPARNRVISGLAGCVVVVEAPEKSGSLITARHATDAGNDVWAMPGPVGFAECRGSNKLLADGAGVLWDIDEFVDSVAPRVEEPLKLKAADKGTEDPAALAGLPEQEKAALMGVGFEPAGIDVISGRSGVSMRELLAALALLELKGYVKRDAGGAFARSPLGRARGGAR
ncbi:MAG: Rossmann fold nucleotide-binding protein Smf possibly involved in DNA uptake [uncultured Rubrobacteraceae bacterium]|uniref:Rossmann fold nucleotide-binding protein Smf possibly involved in DNA uptake n=1 Tax=uncultured Rubrobacteraceae bacterium TaxID=349277 RepID=A0A6J4R2E0_9ACTN|nr:MAG: Rossmann fold nucleotide-binding protein Smf possibly involved in DNA uptake [uncultured Rubrobacteraceae bacterium]